MANITIPDLRSTGANLFQDSESFLNDLTDMEVADVLGGFKLQILWSGLCVEW